MITTRATTRARLFRPRHPALPLARAAPPRAWSSAGALTAPASPPAVPGPSLFNSLSGHAEPLPAPRVASAGRGDNPNRSSTELRRLTWYACGPTVYDSTHLGHARSYVNTDIIRRTLTDFFGYRIHFVLGMTDIDDKIVARARETGEPSADLARRCEQEFMEDLATLNVLPPTVITRVTEHIPDILAYVGEIVKNGHGYELEDGVYFDVASLGDRYAHGLGPSSAREVNAGVDCGGDAEEAGEQDEGNGDNDDSGGAIGKRDARDFALWKKHSTEDPENVTWDSPWGPGRPGWHIECSAMIDAVLGSRFDIHSGGVDLCFPHHCNEVAQAQAFLQEDEWADFFLHTGHLHISGRKMSKSLKNFITVRELLGRESGEVEAGDVSPADCFRMFVLCHHYRSNITFSEDRMRDAKAELLKFRRFVKRLQRHDSTQSGGPSSPTKQEREGEEEMHPHRAFFLGAIHSTEEQVYASLADDFNTPDTVAALREFCAKINTYLDAIDEDPYGSRGRSSSRSSSSGGRPVPGEFLAGAAHLVEDTLGRLGVGVKSAPGDSGGGGKDSSGKDGGEGEEAAVGALVDFREAVRDAARNKVSWGEIYRLCDEVRDVTAPDLGWKITDGKGRSKFYRNQ
jgi:cysteinyl-tRNA synthetase